MKKISNEDLENLEKKNWIGNEKHFETLKKGKPENDLERFYRFSYMMRFSRFKAWASSYEGQKTHIVERLPNIKKRLSRTSIFNKDYQAIKEYDSPETFFYLDPPYPDTPNKTIGGNLELSDLASFCKNLKGKFILSLNSSLKVKKAFEKFIIKTVKVWNELSNVGDAEKYRTELLISNFPLKKLNIYLAKTEESLPALEDYENLLHHIHIDEKGKEEIHHCLVFDHIANMFKQTHLWIKDGKVYLDGKQVQEGVFHVVKGLEPEQEIVWSDEEAKENRIKPKKMKAGMTLKEKAKEW